MAKSVKDKPVKQKPEWLQKIVAENLEEANRAFEGRNNFIAIKLDLEAAIINLNEKYGTTFEMADLFSIQPEEEEVAIDMLGLEGSDDNDD